MNWNMNCTLCEINSINGFMETKTERSLDFAQPFHTHFHYVAILTVPYQNMCLCLTPINDDERDDLVQLGLQVIKFQSQISVR